MHVVFVSQCDHRAIKRTARVLDAYAHRQGDRTWMTPITREGLETLHAILRTTATRQTAVACYANQGLRQMRLLWIVGAKSRFGPNGVVAVASRQRPLSTRTAMPMMPIGWRIAALLARLSGYLHDLGKFGLMFQDKLAGMAPMRDAVRHEWLSLHLLWQFGQVDAQTHEKVTASERLAGLERMALMWAASWDRAATDELLRMNMLTANEGGKKRRFQNRLTQKNQGHEKGPLSMGLTDPWAALLFLVFTHHRLPEDQAENTNILSDTTYIDSQTLSQARPSIKPVASPCDRTIELVKKTASRLLKITETVGNDPVFWRAVVTVARMGLILADHSVSSVDKTAAAGHGPDLQRLCESNEIKAAFANTVGLPNGARTMNQELNWHLQHVGNRASDFVSHFTSFAPSGLSASVVSDLNAPTTGRFAWQGMAAAVLRDAQTSENLPTLVFNVAGTGCGKTRMNAVAVAALRQIDGPDAQVRFATALNLRTLTLQTRDAYADQLGMSDDELACVIGSAITKQLHDDTRLEAHKQDLSDHHAISQQDDLLNRFDIDEDGNPPEESYDVVGGHVDPPVWLEHFLERKPSMRSVVMSPVLVCTIDHLIKAGEPTEQGNYALTNLRLMTSDLVLDEIDSYDPKALVAVMRLITAAAFWGRHVIASSATLSLPVACGVWNAYTLGANMRITLYNTTTTGGRFRVSMLDDKSPARLSVVPTEQAFRDWFTASLQQMLQTFGRASFRPAELADVRFESSRTQAVLNAIDSACKRMHTRHQWTVIIDDEAHLISIGLVRIANINCAVDVARYLANQNIQARIACYHSQISRIGRFMLERSLDRILTRKDDQHGPQHTSEIQDAVRRSRQQGLRETMFVVVATPVEEIGRDHDFDWAVIEPSSVQSIVQTVGRVNRHRLVEVDQPNVAVLQYNFKCARNADDGKACFNQPGLETAEDTYPSHNLADLLNWDELTRSGQIDARTRFEQEKHPLADLDDCATSKQLDRRWRRFMESKASLWIGQETYTKVPLREAVPRKVLSRDEHGVHHLEHQHGRHDTIWLKTHVQTHHKLKNDWLVWSFSDCLAEAQRLGIAPFDAFAAEVRANDQQETLGQWSYNYCESLGYFRSNV